MAERSDLELELDALEATVTPEQAEQIRAHRDLLAHVGDADGLQLGLLVADRMVLSGAVIEAPEATAEQLRAVAADLMYWGSLAAKRLLLDYDRPRVVLAGDVQGNGRKAH